VTRIDDVLAGNKSWGKYALDVLGHTGLGAAYALPTTALAVWLGAGVPLTLIIGCICALTGGVVREICQYMDTGKEHFLDRSLDALHHLLGAPVALGAVVLVHNLF
jgi:hypothetical protein